MERFLVSSALALTCFSAQAVDLEVSLMYSDGYTSDSSVLVSSEIVGFYRSIDAANSLFAESNANLTLSPAKIFSVDASVFDPQLNVFSLRYEMDSGALESVSNGAGHFIAGISRYRTNSGGIGYAVPFSDSKYALYDMETDYKLTKKFALVSGINNSNANPRYKYVLAHELLHTIGASHDETDAQSFDSFSLGYDYGHGEDCGDGNLSLMYKSSVSGKGEMMLSGVAGCDAGNGDMVRFINEYAPRVASHESYLNMNTLTMTAFEDVGESEFEFTVTRTKDLDSSSTAYVHVSGSNATITNEIAPVEVVFEANEATKTVTVPFSSVHPMFDDATASDGKVFAVAISNAEVMDELIDLSSINTQWSADSGNDEGDGNTSEGEGNNSGSNNTGSNSSGGGGGGSISFFGLITLLSFGLIRRRNSL